MTDRSGKAYDSGSRQDDTPSETRKLASAQHARDALATALSGVLPSQVDDGSAVTVSDQQLVRVLSPFCATMRRLRMPIDVVTLTCKDAWHSVPAVATIPFDEREVLLGRIVRLCIETFFVFPATTEND